MTLNEKRKMRRRHIKARRQVDRNWGDIIGMTLLTIGFVGTSAWLSLYFAA